MIQLSFRIFGIALMIGLGSGCSRSPKGEITGTVQLENRAVSEGIQIYLPGTQFRAITDKDGKFSISGLDPGEYTLVVSHEGFREFRESMKALSGISNSVGVIVLKELRVPTGKISGFATLAGQTTHEGTVILLVGTPYNTTTSLTGYYLLENIPPGTYKLMAVREDRIPISKEPVEVKSGEEIQIPEIQIAAPEVITATNTLSLVLGKNHLRGIALLEGEEEHNGIRVALEDLPEKYTLTSATGTYELTELDEAPHTLIFSHPGFFDESVPNAVPVPATSTQWLGFVTLRKEVQADNLGILQGTVLLAGQTNHANTVVRLMGVSQVVVTDPGGRYLFVGAPVGDYILQAEHPGYEPGQIPLVHIAANRISLATDLTLQALQEKPTGTGTVLGDALLEGEVDHGGIMVSLEGTTLNTVTNSEGHYIFDQVPVGAYTIIFSKGGFKNYYLQGIPVKTNETNRLEPITLLRDVKPPYVLETFPQDGTRRVPVYGYVDVIVRFSERMDGASVKQAVLINPPVDFGAFFDRESELSNLDVLHLRLFQEGNNPIRLKTRYRIEITPVARNPQGITLEQSYVFTFATDGPLIVRTQPPVGDMQALMGIGQPLVFECNAPVDPGSFERAIRFRPNPDAVPQFQYVRVGAGSRILVYTALRPGSRYRVQIENTLRTLDGQPFSNTPFNLIFAMADTLSQNPPGIGGERSSRVRRR